MAKKIIALLMVISMVGSIAFAEDAKAKVANDPFSEVEGTPLTDAEMKKAVGGYVINNVAAGYPSVEEWQQKNQIPPGEQELNKDGGKWPSGNQQIELPNGMNDAILTSSEYYSDSNTKTSSKVEAVATILPSGNYRIDLSIKNKTEFGERTTTATIAFASGIEVESGRLTLEVRILVFI